ncbi:MAG: hypothetical protein R2695_10945 [Acidimicrobiales bacterium]
MVELKPGARFQSTVCTTEVIVVKGAGEADLTCGGAAMVPAGTASPDGEPAADAAEGTPSASGTPTRATRSSCWPPRRVPDRSRSAAPRSPSHKPRRCRLSD